MVLITDWIILMDVYHEDFNVFSKRKIICASFVYQTPEIDEAKDKSINFLNIV